MRKTGVSFITILSERICDHPIAVLLFAAPTNPGCLTRIVSSLLVFGYDLFFRKVKKEVVLDTGNRNKDEDEKEAV